MEFEWVFAEFDWVSAACNEVFADFFLVFFCVFSGWWTVSVASSMERSCAKGRRKPNKNREMSAKTRSAPPFRLPPLADPIGAHRHF